MKYITNIKQDLHKAYRQIMNNPKTLDTNFCLLGYQGLYTEYIMRPILEKLGISVDKNTILNRLGCNCIIIGEASHNNPTINQWNCINHGFMFGYPFQKQFFITKRELNLSNNRLEIDSGDDFVIKEALENCEAKIFTPAIGEVYFIEEDDYVYSRFNQEFYCSEYFVNMYWNYQ